MVERELLEDGFYEDLIEEAEDQDDVLDWSYVRRSIEDSDYQRGENYVLRNVLLGFTAVFGIYYLGALTGVGPDAAKAAGLPWNPLENRYQDPLRDLVTQATAGLATRVRETYQGILVRGLRGGLSAEEITRQIRMAMFLLDRDAAAVERLRRLMERQGQVGISIREREIYRQALLRRLRMIAATALTAAITAVQLGIWNDAIRQGSVPPSVMKRWKTVPDERRCEFCRPLTDVTIPINSLFDGTLAGPPAHPLCRCELELVIL